MLYIKGTITVVLLLLFLLSCSNRTSRVARESHDAVQFPVTDHSAAYRWMFLYVVDFYVLITIITIIKAVPTFGNYNNAKIMERQYATRVWTAGRSDLTGWRHDKYSISDQSAELTRSNGECRKKKFNFLISVFDDEISASIIN